MALISYQLMVTFNVRSQLSFAMMIKLASQFKLISGWYVEMYVGVLLFSPFLNRLFYSLTSNEKKYLFFSLVVTTALPNMINNLPIVKKIFFVLAYWINVYPLVYYFIGMHFREKYDKGELFLETKYYIVYFTVLSMITGLVFFSSRPYTYAADGYYGSLLQILLASSLFIILFSYFENKNSNVIGIISKYTLTTYIASYPIDKILYPKLIEYWGEVNSLFPRVLLVLFMSYFLSFVWGILIQKILNSMK